MYLKMTPKTGFFFLLVVVLLVMHNFMQNIIFIYVLNVKKETEMLMCYEGINLAQIMKEETLQNLGNFCPYFIES